MCGASVARQYHTYCNRRAVVVLVEGCTYCSSFTRSGLKHSLLEGSGSRVQDTLISFKKHYLLPVSRMGLLF